jgi:hypothetical protein
MNMQPGSKTTAKLLLLLLLLLLMLLLLARAMQPTTETARDHARATAAGAAATLADTCTPQVTHNGCGALNSAVGYFSTPRDKMDKHALGAVTSKYLILSGPSKT